MKTLRIFAFIALAFGLLPGVRAKDASTPTAAQPVVQIAILLDTSNSMDGLIAQAFMSIHAIKAVGIGLGDAAGSRPGSEVHDEILAGDATGTLPGIVRPTNRAGGLEGGITTGEDVRVTAVMKPIAQSRG